jgi:tetratricopeptide (TPR) repeat protein
MRRHPERRWREAFLVSLDPAAAEIVGHLVSCKDCGSHALSVLRGRQSPPGRHDLPPLDYSGLWQHLDDDGARTFATLCQERSDAEPLLDELLRRSPAERLNLVRRHGRFHSWVLADLLLAQANAQPAQREEFARLALAISEHLADGHPDWAVADLQAVAHCEIGEALRAHGERDAAELAFARAAELLTDSFSILDRAKFCQFLARLRRDQERVDEALGLLERAADLLEEVGNLKDCSAVLGEVGFLYLEVGEPRPAWSALLRAVECLWNAGTDDRGKVMTEADAKTQLLEEVEKAIQLRTQLQQIRSGLATVPGSRASRARAAVGCIVLDAMDPLIRDLAKAATELSNEELEVPSPATEEGENTDV